MLRVCNRIVCNKYTTLVLNYMYMFEILCLYVSDIWCNLKMQNDQGEIVDSYIPRCCSASNGIIGSKDHASIQMQFVEVRWFSNWFLQCLQNLT